jgi:hypothetical protein
LAILPITKQEQNKVIRRSKGGKSGKGKGGKKDRNHSGKGERGIRKRGHNTDDDSHYQEARKRDKGFKH